MEIELKILDPRIKEFLPSYATDGSAGLDLRARTGIEIIMYPNDVATIQTGIAVHIKDKRYAGMLLPRSSLGRIGLVLSNTVGLIDSDYQGQLIISALNRGEEVITIHPLERIAQLVIVPVKQATFKIVDSFVESARGEGGFGSTGK